MYFSGFNGQLNTYKENWTETVVRENSKRRKREEENMALFMDEGEIWKCSKHPSKSRRTGICPICLRNRLVTLCPNCAHVRPCGCYASTSSSSSSSSSLSRFSFDVSESGVTARVSNLIDSEPAFRRSRSLSIPFLRSRSRLVGNKDSDSGIRNDSPASSRTKYSSLWSMFKSQQSEKNAGENEEDGGELRRRRSIMMRSRSVTVTKSDACNVRPPVKERGWHFPSPIKVFRNSRISKVVQKRSPLNRGLSFILA